ncbi:MAG: hypothetical protein ACW990_00270 [Promethearchaeota archaeon]|jgi:hypothetical protein
MIEYSLEEKIIQHLLTNKQFTCITAVEVAHEFKKTFRQGKEALESLRYQKKLWSHDISSSNERIGQGTGNTMIRKFQEPFYVFYLPNSNYLRKR